MIFPILGSRSYRFITPELFHCHRESRTCLLYLYPYYRYSTAEAEAERKRQVTLVSSVVYVHTSYMYILVPYCKVKVSTTPYLLGTFYPI